MIGAYLDDVLVGLPAAAAARVPELAAEAFARARCVVEQQKTKVWVPAGLCPSGCQAWWSPRGLRILGAPQGTETPLAALGELGAAVGSASFVTGFLEQALAGYRAFTDKVVEATLEADRHWSRVQGGAGLLRLCALPRLQDSAFRWPWRPAWRAGCACWRGSRCYPPPPASCWPRGRCGATARSPPRRTARRAAPQRMRSTRSAAASTLAAASPCAARAIPARAERRRSPRSTRTTPPGPRRRPSARRNPATCARSTRSIRAEARRRRASTPAA